MNRLVRPDALVGSYRLADFLGAGGMGEVYRATHVRTGRVVAIKILSAQAIEARWLARFYHEARVQHGLEHPNIVRLHELIDLQGRPCLVMEYVDGESLGERIERERRLPPREALRIFHAIASAVAYVHARDIVHRDLKPANVRLTRDGVVKLLDFGISKSRHAEGLTQTGKVIGTPRYLAPEQLLGDRVTRATDVWALGVLFYEMVTGTPPFTGNTPEELWAQITNATYTAPSARIGAIGDDAVLLRRIDRLIASCIARHVERRPSAGALAVSVHDVMTGSSSGAARLPVRAGNSGGGAVGRAGLDGGMQGGARAIAAAAARMPDAMAPAARKSADVMARAARDGGHAAASFARDVGARLAAAGSRARAHAHGRRMQDVLERWWLPITAASVAIVFLMVILLLSPPRRPGGGASGGSTGGSTAGSNGRGGAVSADHGVHHIDVVTGRATVYVNGQPLGQTPVEYVGRIGETVAVELRQPGYEPLRQDIQVTTTGTSTLTMTRSGSQP